MIINFLIFLICVSLAEFLWDIPYLTRIICLFYHKAIIYPLLHMIKFSFTTFASCEYMRKVYLQDAKVVNERFIMCYVGRIIL